MVSQSPVAALWRLRPYLRPYRKQLTIMVTAALAAEAADIAVPLVTKAVIDGAIAHHERGLLLPLGLLAVALGAASASLSLIRRWVQGNAVAGMEKAIRDDLYAHLQRLEPAFHDEWQSGQLLSRATTDLGTIRRFMGFGIVFLFISTMTFTAVSALLISLNWWLGLITMAMFAPVFALLPQVREEVQGPRQARAGPGRRPHHAGRGGGDRGPGAQGTRPRAGGRGHALRPGGLALPDAGRDGRRASAGSGRCSPWCRTR